MAVLNKLFRRARGMIDSGYIIVGGRETMGPGDLFTLLAEEACHENRILFIMDAKQEEADRIACISRLGAHITGGTGYIFSPDVGSRATFDAFDAFSACSTPLEKASLLADLLVLHSMDPKYRGDAATYFQYVIEVKRTGRLKDILVVDPRSALAALPASDPAIGMKKIFIDTFRTRTYENILAAINILLHSPEADLMSGPLKLGNVFRPGNVIVVSDSAPVSGVTIKNGLFRSILLVLMLGLRRYDVSDGVFLLRHADFIEPENLEALVNTAQAKNSLFVWMPENIAPIVHAGGGPILERVDFLSVFQADKISAETWASMFGHRERIKISTANTSPKSIFGSLGLGLGSIVTGGMSTRSSSWRGTRTVNTSKEDKQNVTADQISTQRKGRTWCLYPDGSYSQEFLYRR